MNLKDSEKDMYFYTGLSNAQFLCLWNFFGPNIRNMSRVSYPRKLEVTPTKARGPRRKLTPEDELLLTLILLRLGLLHEDIAFRFGIAVSTVNDIVSTWIQFIDLYHQFNKLRSNMFPSRKKIQKHPPKSFRKFNKRPMDHIAYLSKQFKSINTYDYVTFLN